MTTIIESALKQAAERAAGISLHRIVGAAEPSDLRILAADLRMVAHRIVDPLVEAFGRYAAEHANGIDLDQFTDQLSRALGNECDGGALYELESAAKRLAEAADEVDSDTRYKLRREYA